MQVCRYVGMQVCRYVGMQVCRYTYSYTFQPTFFLGFDDPQCGEVQLICAGLWSIHIR